MVSTQSAVVSPMMIICFSSHSGTGGHGTLAKSEKSSRPSPPRITHTPEFCIRPEQLTDPKVLWGSTDPRIRYACCSGHWSARHPVLSEAPGEKASR